MQISPMAQVALLHTEMNSGFRFVPRIGMNSAEHTYTGYYEVKGVSCRSNGLVLPMQGLTCGKQALVRSPSRANELCLTSGIGSYKREYHIQINKSASLQNATINHSYQYISLVQNATINHSYQYISLVQNATLNHYINK